MPVLEIDNQKIEVTEGTNVIEAAEELGIFIPRFCYHPALGSVGACRVCAVNFLEGPVKGIEMSCMVKAEDGMKISTTDTEAVEFRKYIIECLMRNHPHDCPVCDEGGHCLLQDLTVAGGHSIRQYQGPKRTYTDQNLGPLIQHEMNRCIQCYRCVRYYQEYTGYKDLGVMGIADRIYYGRFQEGQLESPFSGNLIDICPTGVFTDKPSRYLGRRWDFERSDGICTQCSLGCNTTVSTRYRSVVRQEARFNPDVNGHFICDRGRYGFQDANLPQRPRQASIDGQGVPSNKATDEAAKRIAEIESRFGKSSVAIMGSDRSSLETLAVLSYACQNKGWQKPAIWPRKLGNTVKAAVSSLSPETAISMHEIESADFVLIAGADILNESPMLALALRQAQRKNSSIWIADPRSIELPFPFEQIPCDNAATLELLQQVIDQVNNTSGKQEAIINDPRIQALAAELSNSERPVVICGTDIPTPDTIVKTKELAEVLKVQKDSGLFFVLPHANSYGAALLSKDHQPMEDILDKIQQDEIKAVIFLESDVLEHFSDRRQLELALELALEKLELIVTIDYLDNSIYNKAHIQVPAKSVYEAGGIYVNQEGRPQYSHIAHIGGLPISDTGQGSHPPRTFQKDIPGTDMLPAWKAIQNISDTMLPDSVNDIVIWMEETFPQLSGLSKVNTEDVRLFINRTSIHINKKE
jgi:NADH-quinone oxidoreductase subunit G